MRTITTLKIETISRMLDTTTNMEGTVCERRDPQNITDAKSQQSFQSNPTRASKNSKQIQFEKEACSIKSMYMHYLYL